MSPFLKCCIVLFGGLILTAAFNLVIFFLLGFLRIPFDSVGVLIVFPLIAFLFGALRILATKFLYPKENADLQVLGGFTIGSVFKATLFGGATWAWRGTWPFAQIVVTPSEFRLDTPTVNYRWAKEDVPRLVKRLGWFPPFWPTGLRIENADNYPVTFYPLRFSVLHRKLRQLGYKIEG